MDSVMNADEYLNPDWSNKGKVHNWRNYVSDELKRIWPTFTSEQKRVVAEAMRDASDMEDWD